MCLCGCAWLGMLSRREASLDITRARHGFSGVERMMWQPREPVSELWGLWGHGACGGCGPPHSPHRPHSSTHGPTGTGKQRCQSVIMQECLPALGNDGLEEVQSTLYSTKNQPPLPFLLERVSTLTQPSGVVLNLVFVIFLRSPTPQRELINYHVHHRIRKRAPANPNVQSASAERLIGPDTYV